MIGLAIAPRRHTAQQNATASHQFGSCHATMSPGPHAELREAALVGAGDAIEVADRDAQITFHERDVLRVGRGEAIEQRLVGPGARRAPPLLELARCGTHGSPTARSYCAP